MFYHYDINSGELVGTYPVSTFPGSETEVDPPQLTDGIRRRWNGTIWREVPTIIARRTDQSWSSADAFARNGMDPNSRHSIDLLLAQNTLAPLPAIQLQRILAYGAWWQSVWAHYGEIKARIEAGEDAHFDAAVPGPCPFTIWQIAGN